MLSTYRRLFDNKAICGYWDRLTRDSLSIDLNLDFVKKKWEKRLLFIDEGHRLYGALTHNRINAALQQNDDLNFHCLWWQTCVKVRLEFKFGFFVICFFCWVVNTARWCSNLVTSFTDGRLYHDFSCSSDDICDVGMRYMNNYESSFQRSKLFWYLGPRFYWTEYLVSDCYVIDILFSFHQSKNIC